MIKKGFNLLLALFMFVSVTSMQTSNTLPIANDCVEEAFDAMEEALDYGNSALEASCLGNLVYGSCIGYPFTIEDVADCFE